MLTPCVISLAGSERYEDSKAHDKLQMDQSRENNKSLMNLKDCVRAKAKMTEEEGFVHIPWRANKLTMVLKVAMCTTRYPCGSNTFADMSSLYLTLNQDSLHGPSSSHMCLRISR
jgi:hypothetical protein